MCSKRVYLFGEFCGELRLKEGLVIPGPPSNSLPINMSLPVAMTVRAKADAATSNVSVLCAPTLGDEWHGLRVRRHYDHFEWLDKRLRSDERLRKRMAAHGISLPLEGRPRRPKDPSSWFTSRPNAGARAPAGPVGRQRGADVVQHFFVTTSHHWLLFTVASWRLSDCRFWSSLEIMDRFQ